MKTSCTVLRGQWCSNALLLPDAIAAMQHQAGHDQLPLVIPLLFYH
ncbi:Rpn family recombination-promoting nuclease/putative transposase [Mycetohabitans rhizoxinica]